VDYWVPARASPVEPGSLGRDDSPYAIALPSRAAGGEGRGVVSKLQWLERRGTDLLNRQMLVRIQSGAPLVQSFHGRVAQRMSADFLHRRMHVRLVSRSPIRRVNWAGAQRRLLSDRPAQPVRIVLSTLRQINAGMTYWGACLASNQDV
jgi:hypothetical protein